MGKTIETGLILRYLLISKKVKPVLILAPASIQPQWQEELREKFNLHFWSYSKGELKNSYGERSQSGEENIWNSQNLILASSHLVRRSDRTKQLLDAQPWDLVILDEAPHARRQSPQNRKETLNRLLQLMQQLKEKSRSLLLLSATPMQINTLEVFDLLQLLGLRGHWSYGKNFCNYFSTWHLMTFYPDIFDENASLQLMSFGNPLFEEMLEDLAPRPNCPSSNTNRTLWGGLFSLFHEFTLF